MYNAVSKYFVAAVIATLMTACSSTDPDKIAAQAILDSAQALADANLPDSAMVLIDSLNKTYPKQIEVRRAATALQPQLIEKITMRRIATADSIIALSTYIADSIAPLLRHVPGGELEGYYVVKDAYNPSFINATGLEPRVNDADFRFYIVAQSKSKKIGLNQISLNTASEMVESQAIPASSDRVMVLEGSEMATFLAEESDTIGRWAAAHPDIKGAMLLGSKGNLKVNLTDKQAKAFATAWRYADAKQRLRSALIMREKLDRQLQIARDQIANTALGED